MVMLGTFIGLYILTILNIPPNPSAMERYGLTEASIRIISLSVALPYIVIWAAAFYGFIRFKQYTDLIQDSPDGKPLATIANGLMILAFSFLFL